MRVQEQGPFGVSITVWGVGTARTLRVHWALAELNVPYATRPIGPRTGETRTARFRGLSVKEKVPVLTDGDFTLTESAAIVTWLGDRFGVLTPAPGTLERARYGEWLSYMLTELDAHTLYVMRKHGDLRHIYGEAPAAVAAAKAGFEKQIRWALPRVEASPYLVGARFGGADIVMTTCLDWAVAYGFELAAPLEEYRQRHRNRAGYRQAAACNRPVDRPSKVER